MSDTAVAVMKPPQQIGVAEQVLLKGDLSSLNESQRIAYYKAVCESVGLNPFTKPFEYLELDGGEKGGQKKLVLYAKRDCTDQLRNIHGVSVKIVAREVIEGVYVVTAQASKPDGRVDEAIGAVPLVKEGGKWEEYRYGNQTKKRFKSDGTYHDLSPVDKANAIMKAETKAKRRVTLSICGLGMLDESEIDSVAGSNRVAVTFDGSQQLTSGEPEPNEQLRELLERLETPGEAKKILDEIRANMKKHSGDEEAYKAIFREKGIKDAKDLAELDFNGWRGLITALYEKAVALMTADYKAKAAQEFAEAGVLANGK